MAALLSLRDANVTYCNKQKRVYAAKHIDLDLEEGSSLGIVGESGSGKSTLAMALLRLLPEKSTEISGEALFEGKNLFTLPLEEYRQLRWKEIAAVFQKSMNSLSPVHRIREQISDIYQIHELKALPAEIEERTKDLFSMVNLNPRVYNLYPHELSGGMLQRVSIAMSLLFNPKLLILDEATTALDVVTQGQILKEIVALEGQFRMSRIMITHDMSVVSKSCAYVAVMYAGELMEWGLTAKVLVSPHHPYTQGLLASFPDLKSESKALKSIPGFIPDLSLIYPGCVFAERCPSKMEKCQTQKPRMHTLEGGKVACHLYEVDHE
ncbi:MAG: ABC transporter ATP-binding protein [Anaerolineaceae bacterium]|nr:ABC transporter ATP-binding protein [Anaerolineaceae bacterium]